ncbi:MAG TPA: adenylate/guanylate cyclase domain-containing protein [Actinomycetota bacterium]|nr:adenylate/guanylate cyclase domain-containing protein [Actinomycetota bacterium]
MGGERRRSTVLFADIVGFSTLAEHLDPEELRALITTTFRGLRTEIESREGMVEKFIGDAVMAVFGVPVAHEDDPQRAVEAALAMLEEIQRRSERMPSPLRLRIGINSGLVVSGSVGDGTQTGVMGDAVNVAARLQQAAEPDEVVVSASVWRRARDRFDATAVGLLEVKGRSEPVEAYRVTGSRPIAARRLGPFVGRAQEMALLELLWSSAAKGNTHVVSLLGEPGVGKSRLLAEFPVRESALDVRIQCSSERAFGPFLELLEKILGRRPLDLGDLRTRTAALGVSDEIVPLLAALLGLAEGPPPIGMADDYQKRQVMDGMWRFLQEAPHGRPALIVLEDVYSADRSSLELLGFLLERLGGVPVMLVLAYRPGFDQIERTPLRASHTWIHVEPLSTNESVQLARGFLGVEEVPADLDRLVTTRAEGNPFFIEELLQALVDLGSLTVVDGVALLAEATVEVPDTVEGTIVARVDRLGPTQRNLLQHAAVIGRRFSTDLVQAVLDREDVASHLNELARTQLIVAESPDQWSFKHALIQQVTYETMLQRHRRGLHRKVAEALETLSAKDHDLVELLAEHYARAEMKEKARQYAQAAGDAAGERMGFIEAKRYYQTAARLWGEGDEGERLALLMKLAWAALISGDPATARTSLIEAEAGWRAIGNMRQAGASLATLGRVYFWTGDAERASGVIRQAIEVLEEEEPSPELVRAIVWNSTLSILTGRTEEGTALTERGLELAQSMHLEAARSNLQTSLGMFEVMRGDATGVDRIQSSLVLAQELGDAEAIGRAYLNLALTMQELAQNVEGVEVCRRGRENLRDLGAPSFEWTIASFEAGMLVELGRFHEAEALCREIMGPQRAVTAGPALVFAGRYLATILIRLGRYEECRQLLDDVLPPARRTGGSLFLSPVLMNDGELEEARGNIAAARQAISESVRVALSGSAVAHWFRPLVPAARLRVPEWAEILERVRDRATNPSLQAPLTEAIALIERDVSLFAEAGDLYASIGLPYQEARCRLEAGDVERGRDIIVRLGLHGGPLSHRLKELLGEPGSADPTTP